MEQNKPYHLNHPNVLTALVCSKKSNRAFQKLAEVRCLKRIQKKQTIFLVGFTLIELLVVIAIIALLLAILTPSLSLAKRYSKAVVCGTNLRRIGVGLSLYAQDNRDFYPRALPLVGGPASFLRPADWEIPWPSDICPMAWQAGYPALLAPYLTDAKISNPFDQMKLRDEMGDDNIDFFRCPDNRIERSDTSQRKCGFPLDYGLHNRASQNRQTDPLVRRGFLAADQTWGLAFIKGSDTSGLNKEPELDGWWNPFLHPKESINVLFPSYNVERLSQEEFIRKFNTVNPPIDDPL